LRGLSFYSEDVGDMFFWNVGWLLMDSQYSIPFINTAVWEPQILHSTFPIACKRPCIFTNKRVQINPELHHEYPRCLERICYRYVRPNFKLQFNDVDRFLVMCPITSLAIRIAATELIAVKLVVRVICINFDQM
jgi:hypothetical protein